MRIFDLSAQDHQSGLEVISAVQAFLDTRTRMLPPSARRAREERLESQDEFGSFGFELDPTTVAQLGGDVQVVDEDVEVATVSCYIRNITDSDYWRNYLSKNISIVVGYLDNKSGSKILASLDCVLGGLCCYSGC